MFIHLYKVLFCVLSFTHRQVIWTAQHLYTEGVAGTIVPQVFTESSKLAIRAGFFYSFNRATSVGIPCVGDTRSLNNISIQDKIVTLKIDAQASTLISCPQSYKLAISRPKRGGVEVIVTSHIPWASPMWSIPPLPEDHCWLPHNSNPSTLNFSPLI